MYPEFKWNGISLNRRFLLTGRIRILDMILYNIIFVLVQLYRRNIFASASSRFNSFVFNRTLHPYIMLGSRIFSKWMGSSNNVF